jgi:hypothetical protein
MVLELQRADRMRDAFDRIRLPVREIVHRIDAPLVRRCDDARRAECGTSPDRACSVRRRHVDLRAQRARAVRKLARAHALEKIQALFHRTVAVRALLPRLRSACRGTCAPLPPSDRTHTRCPPRISCARPLIQLAEIIGRVKHAAFPVEAQPAHVLDDRIDVLLLFLLGIRVVEAQIALAAELRGQAESSGRSISRGRCADIRSAREEIACALVRRTCWS